MEACLDGGKPRIHPRKHSAFPCALRASALKETWHIKRRAAEGAEIRDTTLLRYTP